MLASYFFYGWWSWEFCGLLILITLLDYAYGFGVASVNRKKAKVFLWLSVINNLTILGIFKYFNFFSAQIQSGLDSLGFQINSVLIEVALPIGISFYTFHGMSYVFDIFRGNQKPVRSFVDYAVFVSFFPLLVAGPIERATHLLPQIQKPRFFNYTQAVEGCKLIAWGLFKKVVIADSLAIVVDGVFNDYTELNGIVLILGAIGFSFQIYCDFSGYSDIALGTAKLFGFELLSNFKFPYFSRSIAEFWRRWHISLSSWFKDYLYIPLGGSRVGSFKLIRNTFVIFLVSGFWHGASWNFIAWGFIHACGFLPLLILRKNRKHVSSIVAYDKKIPSLKELVQMISTFAFVTFAWIFFRADGIFVAFDYISRMVTSISTQPEQMLSIPAGKILLTLILPLPIVIGDWILRRDERSLSFSKSKYISTIIFVTLIVIVSLFLDTIKSSFIYFQF